MCFDKTRVQQVISKDEDGTYTVRFKSTKVPGAGTRMKESGVPESDLREVRGLDKPGATTVGSDHS